LRPSQAGAEFVARMFSRVTWATPGPMRRRSFRVPAVIKAPPAPVADGAGPPAHRPRGLRPARVRPVPVP
jgi:hypothetical protein